MQANATGASQSLESVVNGKLAGLSEKAMSFQFDIEPLMLSDKEVMKKLIAKSNPRIPARDLNLMVYGNEFVPKVNLEEAAGAVRDAAASAGTAAADGGPIDFSDAVAAAKAIRALGIDSAGAGLTLDQAAAAISGQVKGGARLVQGTASGVTTDLAGSSAEFVARIRNRFNRPVMRSWVFTGRRADGVYTSLVVHQIDAGTPTGAAPSSGATASAPAAATSFDQARFMEEFEGVARKQAEARLGGFSPYPIPEDGALRKLAKDKKKEMREAFAKFVSKQKQLVNDFVSTLTLLSSSIPAMAIMVTTPPFNIPSALTLISLVMQAITKIIGAIVDFIELLGKLQQLSSVLGDKAYRQVARVITPLVEVLSKLLEPIAKLRKFIEKIIEQVKKLFNSDSCKKHRRRLGRDIRRKERDIKNERDPEEKADLEDELKLLKDRLAELDKNCKKTSIDQDTEDINKLLQETNDLGNKIADDLAETLVYDVVLPSGELLEGVSEQALEELKNRYTVIIVGEDQGGGVYKTPTDEPAY